LQKISEGKNAIQVIFVCQSSKAMRHVAQNKIKRVQHNHSGGG